MAGEKREKVIYILSVIIYAVFGVLVTNYATNYMAENEFQLIGTKARDLAILAANCYEITDAEVREIKRLEFIELLNHPANHRLEALFKNYSANNDIRFVYIMVKLNESQIKYHVTYEYAEFYETEAGTPLDLLWLVDIVTDSTVEEILIDDGTYYDDIKRYSFFRPEDIAAYQERVPTYSLAYDEYGRVINGLAPVYSVEGTFVGMLGVDIYIEMYEGEIARIRNILSFVFFIPTVLLSAAFVFLYIRDRRKIYSTAYTDPLLSIKNRRYINKFLPAIVKEHFKNQLPLSVIMVDVDFFKLYNDHYGHQKGDEALIKIAGAVNSAVRLKTDVVCRYGGEEILVILPHTAMLGAKKIAERIKFNVAALAIKTQYGDASGAVTVSQGIYSAVPKTGDTDKEYILYADNKLYEAKNSGRNKYMI